MNYTKEELQSILKFVRTARIVPTEHVQTKVGDVYFSLDTGKDVVWISKEDLVLKLKSELKELERV